MAVNDGFLFEVDGCRIGGSFQPPKADGYCFILLHGLGSNHHEWKEFCEVLKERGYGYLSYDARGHGSSMADSEGTPVNYRYFINEWQKMADDLERAVRFLNKRGIVKERIIVAGASLGANVALNYCAGAPLITALVLLSPGIEYAGIRTPEIIMKYTGKKLIIAASPGDEYAYKSSKYIISRVPDREEARFIEGVGKLHGTSILNKDRIYTLLDYVGSMSRK